MKWFRFYSEALADPKVQLLPDATFKGWINLLCVINETEPSRGPRSGYLPPRFEDITYKLYGREPEGADRAASLLAELVEIGLLELRSGRYRAHNWPRRQPVSDDVTSRVQETRMKRKGNVTSTVHVRRKHGESTAPEERRGEERREQDRDLEADTEADTEAEEDQRDERAVRRRLSSLSLRVSNLDLSSALEASGPDCIWHCVDEAERHNKLSWAYVDQIRLRHGRDGCPPTELKTRTERLAAAPSRRR